MTAWHCPVCGLNFSFHSELDWHIREDHCLKRTAGLAGQLEREAVISWASLRRLQAAQEGPSVSLFVRTMPGPVMTTADAGNLRLLARRALQEAGQELKGPQLEQIKVRLDEATRAAVAGPTDHGLAIFVTAGQAAVFALPFSPREKVAVNQTFAVGDLLSALQRVPMYRVLVLRGPGFRLFEGRAEWIKEVRDWQVPNPSPLRARYDGGTDEEGSSWTPRQRRQAAFAAADRAIGERVAVEGRLPLVVIGRKSLLAHYRKRSPHAASIVAEAAGWGSMMSRADVAGCAAPLVAAWRERHAADYVEALAEADRQGRVVWGLSPVWEAVLAGKAGWLWVEQGYSERGHLADGGGRPTVLEAGDHPEADDDLVDRVIERAILAGVHVEVVEHLQGGSTGERIAAQLGKPDVSREWAAPTAAVLGPPTASVPDDASHPGGRAA